MEARLAKLREDYQGYLKGMDAEDVRWKEKLVEAGLKK
jgi:hypothetical protein